MVGVPARHRQEDPAPGHAVPLGRTEGVPDIPAELWATFVALARSTRSADELLHAALGHRVTADPVQDYAITSPAAADGAPVWVLQHRLYDPRSAQVLAWCASLVFWQQLSVPLRVAVRDGRATLTQVLHRGGEDWASHPVSTVQRRASDAAWLRWDAHSGRDAPLLQLSRLVTVRGAPVAVVHEEITHPATGRGPPRRGRPHRVAVARQQRTSPPGTEIGSKATSGPGRPTTPRKEQQAHAAHPRHARATRPPNPPPPPGRRRPGRRRASMATGTAAALLLALTACASGPRAGEGGQAVTGTDAERSLQGVCPATVVVQTSWYPESTHGGIYQLLGKGYTLDKARKRVRGPLISQGADTGVQLEVRAGGPAVGNQPVSALMATDTSITLAQQATEEQVRGWAAKQPTVAVAAPFDVDPVVLIWDRKRHPEFRMIQDIGQSTAKVLTFQSPNIDYLLGGGILRPSQIDFSYDGSPSRLLADRGLVVGGFSTNEPFIYRGLGVDVEYQYIETTAYPNYRNTLVVREAARTQLDPCLRRLVPALQRGMVEFMAQPDPVLRLIVALNQDYGSPFPYPLEQARYGVGVMKQDGLVANPTSMRGAPFAALNPTRVTRMLDILRPIYATQRTPVPAEATADALATNDYLDASIRLPTS